MHQSSPAEADPLGAKESSGVFPVPSPGVRVRFPAYFQDQTSFGKSIPDFDIFGKRGTGCIFRVPLFSGSSHIDGVDLQKKIFELLFCRLFYGFQPNNHGLVVKCESVFDDFRIIVVVDEAFHKLHSELSRLFFIFCCD
jgi:hypothetical protein